MTQLKKNPKWFYFVAIIFPGVLLVIVELILFFFSYGHDFKTFIKISDQFENYKFFNPKLPIKYFGNSVNTPSVIADGFKINKEKNTFRIFALGGSTTAGFPHSPNGSFPRQLKNKLTEKYPDVDFEVINLGISAINSITLRDIIDDVLAENPNLIIIYAGHNEYYGALGPASNISGIHNLFLKRILLDLKHFRTVQLIENFIGRTLSIFKNENSSGKTLMSEIAGEELVPLGSELYDLGIEQFESNLSYILSRCSEEKIPALIGTLASNLLQAPLCKYSGCDTLAIDFELAIKELDEDSKEELEIIKDNDELRFRAPEEFNQILVNISNTYKTVLFDVKKSFENESPFKVIGSNLMMDHLHPNLYGNNLIATTILSKIEKMEIINFNLQNTNGPKLMNDSISFDSYTTLDSIFASLRIQFLMNDFPFVNPKVKNNKLIFVPKNIQDSLAILILHGNLSWENAHVKLADFYLRNSHYYEYVKEMNVLIEDKPFDKYPYLKLIKNLEEANQNDLLLYILIKYNKRFQDFFSAKKIAQLFFNQKRNELALLFYQKCLDLSSKDAEVYFYLSAIYFLNKDLPKALQNIQDCVKINPDYPKAKQILEALTRMYLGK